MKDFFDNCWWTIRRFIPRYHGIRIYRPLAWKMILQRIFKGYDESYHWGFYLNLSEYIYPRLLDYYDHLDKAPGVPQKYYDNARDYLLKQGHKFDEGRGRFSSLDIENKCLGYAKEDWKQDVWYMCEAFRDMIAEEQHWDDWHKCWNYDKEHAQAEYNKLTNDAQRKQFWESYGFDREWKPNINFTVYDFSERKRQKGLKLFFENFQSLWS